MTKQPITAAAMALLAAAVLSGCQATGGKRADTGVATETTIEARAEQRWKYLIAKQPEKAYEYLSPGYRSANTREIYAAAIAIRPVTWKGASVVKAECETELCEVFLTLDYEAIIPGAGGKPIQTFAPLREKWIKSGGQWYFLPPK